MARRLDLANLRPELRIPEARPVVMAYLALAHERPRRVESYRKAGASALSLLDLIIIQHIVAFEIAEGGVRQSPIVDSLAAPRRTVRDGLARLEQHGLIVRAADGRYHPTEASGARVNENLDADVRLLGRLCEAFTTWRAAVGRYTP